MEKKNIFASNFLWNDDRNPICKPNFFFSFFSIYIHLDSKAQRKRHWSKKTFHRDHHHHLNIREGTSLVFLKQASFSKKKLVFIHIVPMPIHMYLWYDDERQPVVRRNLKKSVLRVSKLATPISLFLLSRCQWKRCCILNRWGVVATFPFVHFYYTEKPRIR